MARAKATNAAYLQHADGLTLLCIEGIRTAHEATNVTAAIANSLNQSFREGKRYGMLAIPPSVRLTVARGTRIDMPINEDGKIVIKFSGDPSAGSSLLLPGRDF